MVSKIKVKVKAKDANINLPAIPISWVPFLLKIAIRAQSNGKKELLADSEYLEDSALNENKKINDDSELDELRNNDHSSKSKNKQTDIDLPVLFHQIGQVIKEVKPLLKTMEPFTLVEVQSDDAYVLIEMR